MSELIQYFQDVSQTAWGTGWVQWGFYASIVLVIFLEKRHLIRNTFAFFPLLFFVGIFNPLSYQALQILAAGKAYYARMYTMLPVPFCMALGIVLLMDRLCVLGIHITDRKGRIKPENRSTHPIVMPVIKLILTAVICAAIIIGGTSWYHFDWIRPAENLAKLPKDAFEICGKVHQDNHDVTIAVPEWLASYIRQADPGIYMPYGRNLNNLGNELSKDQPDPDIVLAEVGNQGCDYFVVARSERNLDAFSERGFEPFTETEKYLVYKVTNIRRVQRKYNTSRQLISETWLNEKGHVIPGPNGYSSILYAYNEANDRIRESYHNESGAPFYVSGGYTAIVKKFTQYSHQVSSIAYLDENDQKVLVSGRYETRYTYNGQKRLEIEAYFDSDGRPMNRTDTFYASRHLRYNTNGQIIEESYYDTNGKLTHSSYGYAAFRRKYDDEKWLVFESYWDPDGNPIRMNSGYAAFERTYDEAGNLVSERYLDENGHLTARKEGYAELRRTYNEHRQVILESYWDDAGNPCFRMDGIHAVAKVYDAAGNVILETYQDPNGKETLHRIGYSRIQREYDDQKNPVAESYYAFEEPFTLPDGYAALKREYNANRKVIAEAYFNEQGEPVNRTAGYAVLKREYDELSRVIRESYLDAEGNPFKLKSGYCTLVRQYNHFGDIIREIYLDEEGRLIPNSNGYDEVRREYNAERRLIKEAFFCDGRPIDRSDLLYAYFSREYDPRANIIRETYFDTEGSPATCNRGYAEIRKEYNSRGQIIKESYYDPEGQPVVLPSGYATVVWERDLFGNPVQETFLDIQDNSVARTDGIAGIRRKYNLLQQLTEEAYLDPEGYRIQGSAGYAILRRQYDARNNIVSEAYFDSNGNPVISNRGYAEITHVFNNRSQAVIEQYWGEQKNPILIGEGYVQLNREYTPAGDCICEYFTDPHGGKVTRNNHIAEIQRTYNSKRQLIREIYLDANGALVNNVDGIAVRERTYDGWNLTEEIVLSADEAHAKAAEEIAALKVQAKQGIKQTDESYANFRVIAMGEIPEGKLYRSSSPLVGALGLLGGSEGAARPMIAEGLMEEYGIQTVVNMAYTRKELEDALNEKKGDSYYRMLDDDGHVWTNRLPYDYHDEQFQEGLLEALLFMSENDPPYLIHCHGGIDRTGFAATLLEMLMGASQDEIIEDYVESWVNLYGVERESFLYQEIWKQRGIGQLQAIVKEYGDPSVSEPDLREAAKNYLLGIGISEGGIDRLVIRLSGK